MKPLSIVKKENEYSLNMGFLTLDDILSAVKRVMVKYISKFKPMKMDMFLILLGLGVINLLISGYTLFRLLNLL